MIIKKALLICIRWNNIVLVTCVIVTALVKLTLNSSYQTLISVNRVTSSRDLGALRYYSTSEFLSLRKMQQSENNPRCDHAVSDAPPQKTSPVPSGSDSILFLGGGRRAGGRRDCRVVRRLLRASSFIQQRIIRVIELFQTRRIIVNAHRR